MLKAAREKYDQPHLVAQLTPLEQIPALGRPSPVEQRYPLHPGSDLPSGAQSLPAAEAQIHLPYLFLIHQVSEAPLDRLPLGFQ